MNFRRSVLSLIFCAIAWISPSFGLFGAGPTAGGDEPHHIPLPLEEYHDENIPGLWDILVHRVKLEPFNLAASIIFLCAVVHAFMAGYFRKLAHRIDHDHVNRHRNNGSHFDGETGHEFPVHRGKKKVNFWAEICHFLGEVELVFGIWLIPLVACVLMFFEWSTITEYIDGLYIHKYAEPIFVVVIMAIASTRPIMIFVEAVMSRIASFGGATVKAWWISILIIGPLLGSFITEPAAMTLAALLLVRHFYALEPSPKLKYGTIGLLFVNVSVGGTLTHFSAPPVLMVAGKWGWDMAFMMIHFGWMAAVGIAISTVLYAWYFRKEFAELQTRKNVHPEMEIGDSHGGAHVPAGVVLVHIMFLAWTVLTLHHPAMVVGGFLFFLGFMHATSHHQDAVEIKSPLMVGFFLAGLVTHGSLQQWWIAPVLGSLSETPLFVGSVILTAFNDNAMITFLASLVPSFDAPAFDLIGDLVNADHARVLEHAVVAGAVTGGGLTVIANAPNPAGQSILQRFFSGGVSPLKLLLGALVPTIIMGLSFMLLG